MLKIKLIDMVRQDGGDQLTASCELTFGATSVGISMWESDFKALQAAGLFGRTHRPNREGFKNETELFVARSSAMKDFQVPKLDDVENEERSFADGLD